MWLVSTCTEMNYTEVVFKITQSPNMKSIWLVKFAFCCEFFIATFYTMQQKANWNVSRGLKINSESFFNIDPESHFHISKVIPIFEIFAARNEFRAKWIQSENIFLEMVHSTFSCYNCDNQKCGMQKLPEPLTFYKNQGS